MYTKKFSICVLSSNAQAEFSFDKTNLTIESKNRKFVGLIASGKAKKHAFALKNISDIEVRKETFLGEIFLGALIAIASFSLLLAGIVSLIMRTRLAESMSGFLSMYSNGTANIVGQTYGITSLFLILIFLAAFSSVFILLGIAIILNATKVSFFFKADGVESAIDVASWEFSRLEAFADKLIEAKS